MSGSHPEKHPPPNGRRLLLIEPPFYRLYKPTYSLTRYPLSLGYLAATALEHTAWYVGVYNADFTPDEEPIRFSHLTGGGFERYLETLDNLDAPLWRGVRQRLEEYRPHLVGITAKSQNYASAVNVARLVKQVDPATVVVFGGPHPTLVPGTVLRNGACDIVVHCEGELTFRELLELFEGGTDARRLPFKQLRGIHGISFLEDELPVHTDPRSYLEDLDALPFPHLHADGTLWDYELYPDYAFRSVMATRGCPHNCLFCGSRNIWSRRVRFRSPENVAREIQSLRKLGLERVHFEDDTFGVNRRYLTKLCHMLRRNCRGTEWSCEIHVRLVDAETVRLMRDSGCVAIQLGIESGSNRVLKDMRKTYTIEEALEAVELINHHGIEIEAFFIVGFVTDDEESILDTWRAMRRIRGRVSYSIFTPYPDTEAFELCREKGLVDDDFNVALYNHQSPENCFCDRISRARFRSLVGEIERRLDRKNRRQWLRDKLSVRTLRRLRHLGLRESLSRVWRILK